MSTPSKLSLRYLKMTTPSRLSLKKKKQQKVAAPHDNDPHEEKENVPRGSNISSGGSSRRCSTILAGNLFLDHSNPNQNRAIAGNVTSRRKKSRDGGGRGPGLGQLLEDEKEVAVSPAPAADLLTEDESSFYSCPEQESPAAAGGAPGAMDTWMTEVTSRGQEEGGEVRTPQNRPGAGSAIKAANFFSVGRRRTMGPGPQNLQSVLARGSDSDSEGCGEDEEKSDPKFVAQKTFVEDSDNDIKDDMITEDEDDDIPLVQLGKEYLSDSKFEKINSWVQGSPFSKRLSDYSSRVQKSPNQTGNDSIEVVESLLLSDPEDGDIVPSWAAPLPPSSSGNKSKSTTFRDERSSKALLSNPCESTHNSQKLFNFGADKTEDRTSNPGSSSCQDARSSKVNITPANTTKNSLPAPAGVADVSSKFLTSDPSSRLDSGTNAGTSNSNVSEYSREHKNMFLKGNINISPALVNGDSDKEQDDLNDTMEKLEELKINGVVQTGAKSKFQKASLITKIDVPIVISDDENELHSSKILPTKKTAKTSRPTPGKVIENSVNNAVRCWTEVQTKELNNYRQGENKSRSRSRNSTSSDDFENFLAKIKSSKKKTIKSSSESDKDFVVPDDEFDSDEFNDDGPVLNLRDRLLSKQKPSSTDNDNISKHSTSSDSLPDIDTPLTRKSRKDQGNLKSTWRTKKGGDSDSSGAESPTNIYQPKFYNQIPKPSPKLPTKPTLTGTGKKGKTPVPARKPPVQIKPQSSKKPNSAVKPEFKTPTTLTFLSSLTVDTPLERCHPQALTYLKNFKKNKEELARRLYQMYNEQIFENALPDDMDISWNVRLTKTAGLCFSRRHKKYNIETRSSRIELSTKVIDRGDRLRDTLIHEMCHAASWIISGYRDGHGPLWRTWAEKAMARFPELPVIDRCHSYQITTKYTYRCVQCGYSIGRHSKSLDTERKVCGHCHGRFELVVNSGTGGGATPGARGGAGADTPKSKPKSPTAFAKFVKENYKVYRQPGTSHGEVMKIISAKFKETKISK